MNDDELRHVIVFAGDSRTCCGRKVRDVRLTIPSRDVARYLDVSGYVHGVDEPIVCGECMDAAAKRNVYLGTVVR